jgi:ABC-type sulfate/molybdate transport systems ATPase subunit
MLVLDNVSLSYGDKDVLTNMFFEIHDGQIVGIIGESGIGKTSLLKLMAGLIDPTKGKLIFDGTTLIGPSEKLVPGYEDIQLVNQDFALDLHQTVEENVRGKILHLNKQDQDKLIKEVLDLMDLSDIHARKAHVLSGGEQQRLALARALACEPKILLLDEPFVHLDQRLRLEVMNYLLQLNKIRNTTIVLVSHDGAEMMGFAQRLIHIKEGRVERDDSPMSIFYAPDSMEQGELLGILNEIEMNGITILFRSNEYDLDSGEVSVAVSLIRSINTGVYVLNYFETTKGEIIVLSASKKMENVKIIYIKKYETES